MKIAELLDIIEPETTVLSEDEEKRNEELEKTNQLSKKVVPILGALKKHGLDKEKTGEKWKDVSE